MTVHPIPNPVPPSIRISPSSCPTVRPFVAHNQLHPLFPTSERRRRRRRVSCTLPKVVPFPDSLAHRAVLQPLGVSIYLSRGLSLTDGRRGRKATFGRISHYSILPIHTETPKIHDWEGKEEQISRFVNTDQGRLVDVLEPAYLYDFI